MSDERLVIGYSPTTNAGTWPPPEVTLARPVELRRVRYPAIRPRNKYGAKSTSISRIVTVPLVSNVGKISRRTGMRSWITHVPGGVLSAVFSAAYQSEGEVSQPSVTPVPPYSSFGFSTSDSR